MSVRACKALESVVRWLISSRFCFRPYQLGIQFVQVGDDQEAAMFLQQLDDDLKAQAGVRDIVSRVGLAFARVLKLSSDRRLTLFTGRYVS